MNMKRLLALCVALMMLCVAAFAQEAENAETQEMDMDLVLAQVGDTSFTLYDVDSTAYMLNYYGYTETYPDYAYAVDYLVQTAVIEHHLKEAGYDQLSDAEMEAFQNEAKAEWEAVLDDYVNNYLTEDTDEARAALREQALAYYAAQGYSESVLLEEMVMKEAYDRFEKDLVGGYVPTEEEINKVFQEVGANYQAQYEGNVGMYEYYTTYAGYESWYVPEGYRAVTHILLEVDEELLAAYLDAQAAYDETNSAETVDGDLLKAAESALNDTLAKVIASRQEDIDAIYARLEKGENFENLINEYGTDPGMQDPATLAEGYKVHADSIMYDAAFTQGAFQSHMTQPGTYSEPVVGQFGIHIVYYLADVPGGLIMTDDIHAEISEYLESLKLNEAYNAGYPQWSEAAGVTVHTELIEQVQELVNEEIAKMEAEEGAGEETGAQAE